MALKKGFLRSQNTFVKKKRVPTGVFVGVLFSFGLYGFFYLFRESFRIFTNDYGGEILLVLSPKENFIYNFFYAFIASLVGFYVFVKFSVENSINFQNKKLKFKQRHLLAEQAYLKWNFLFVFSKVVGFIGISFITVTLQYDIDFLSEFGIIFILLPLVLFLDLWPIILRATGAKAYKWMLISFIFIFSLSFLYANINFIDYKKINQKIQSCNIVTAFSLEVPRSQTYRKIESRYLTDHIYVVNDSIENAQPLIFLNDISNKIKLEHLITSINAEREKLYFDEIYRWKPNLHIDKKVKLSYFNKIKQELRKANVSNIQLSTSIKHSLYPSNFPGFKYLGMPQHLIKYYPEFENFLDSAERLDFSKYTLKLSESQMYRTEIVKTFNRIKLEVLTDKILVNGKQMNEFNLRLFLNKFINKYQDNYVIIFEPDENISYGRYIEILDLMCSVVESLRERASLETYGESYKELMLQNKHFEIADKYPCNVVEWTPEEKRLQQLLKKTRVF